MLDLSRVTCFAIDNTKRIEQTINALHTCKNVVNFGKVKLVTTPEYVEKYKDECAVDGILVEEQVLPLTKLMNIISKFCFNFMKQFVPIMVYWLKVIQLL